MWGKVNEEYEEEESRPRQTRGGCEAQNTMHSRNGVVGDGKHEAEQQRRCRSTSCTNSTIRQSEMVRKIEEI